MTTAAVHLSDLRKSFGLSFALGPLSLDIPKGAICALVGPNGAGKTTLMNLMMGIGRADDGDVILLGHDVRTAEVQVKRRVAFVSPDLSYRAWGTVGRALDFVSAFYRDWNESRSVNLQYQLGLQRSARIDALSFGERVKLSVLMALSRDADLLLLDEPTAGLDPLARQLLFSELLGFMQNEERTIVISSHQLVELERFADHVAILDVGQLVTCGSIPNLLERYVQIAAVVKAESFAPRAGLQVLGREGNLVRVLLDRRTFEPRMLGALGLEVIGASALTLEELFVALIKGGGTSRHCLFRASSESFGAHSARWRSMDCRSRRH
jgi:ABC-2 type transport system ATP-binding protein